MQVAIDLDKCCGPALNSDIDIPPGAEEKARLAVTSCPERAISLH